MTGPGLRSRYTSLGGRTGRAHTRHSAGSGSARQRWPPRTAGSSAMGWGGGGSRLDPEEQCALLGHDPAVAVDERDLQILNLLGAAAALDLADGLGDVAHAAG